MLFECSLDNGVGGGSSVFPGWGLGQLPGPDDRNEAGADSDFGVDGGVRTQLMVKSGHPVERRSESG